MHFSARIKMTPSAASVPTPPQVPADRTARSAANESVVETPLCSGRRARSHRMPHGAQLEADGSVRFRVWAPTHDSVALQLGNTPRSNPMTPCEGGWHELSTRAAGPGSLYRFLLPDGSRVPDPASRFQPQDVHGPSEVIDPATYQ